MLRLPSRAFACVCLAGLSAFAQVTAPPVDLAPFEVTGTRLSRPLEASPINYTVVSREALASSGRARIGEVLRDLPEFGGNPVTDMVAFNESRGVSAFDLRGLGNGNTLILVNGRRTTVNANAFDLITTYVDLNRFSPAFVERVEILKGGASAIYGADAVGGVVNILTRRRPAGGEASLSYGNTFKTDAAELDATLAAGASRGGLGVSVGIDYFQRHAQAHVDRPFSRSSDETARFTGAYDYYARLPAEQRQNFDGRLLNSGNARFSVVPGQVNGRNGVNVPGFPAGVEVTTLPGTGGLASATPSFAQPFRGTTTGQFAAAAAGTFVAPEVARGDPNARSLFDRNLYIWTLPEANRLAANTRLDYDLAPGVALFGELAGGRNRSRTEYHPREFSGVVPRTNPYNPFGVDVTVEWRIPDDQRRRTITEDDHLSGIVGVHSAPDRALHWETAASYSRDEYVDTTRGLYRASRVQAALASTDPATALNPFGGRDYRQAAPVFNAIATNAWFGGMADLLTFDGQVSGHPWKLPAGRIEIAVFVEHRRERFSSVSDAASRAGDILGTGQSGADVAYSRSVDAIAAELRVPVLPSADGSPLPRLALEGAARREKFSRSFDSGTKPSLGVVARPMADVMVRGSVAKTFRAPSLPQLFSPQSDTFYNNVPDPRRPPALSGDDNDGPNVPRLVRPGGNPGLAPETGRVLQAGAVWSPRAGHGFSAEATWFRYELEDLISGVSPTYVLDNELGGLGSLVHRESNGQSVVNRTSNAVPVLTGPAGQTTLVAPGQSTTLPGRLTRVDVFTVNLSRRRLEGWDFGVRQRGQIAGGTWNAAASGTYTHFSGGAYDRLTPMINSAGASGQPRWRARGALDWTRGAWAAGTTMTYQASSGYHDPNGYYQKPYRVVYVHANYTSPRQSWLRGMEIQLGVDDLFDEDPPLNLDHPIGFSYSTIARPQGRFWRVTLIRKW